MAKLRGTARVNGIVRSTSDLEVVDSPQFQYSWYTDYPTRIPVFPDNGTVQHLGAIAMENWATKPGILQGLDYIVDIRIPGLPTGTVITSIVLPQKYSTVARPTVTPLDGGAIQANGIARFKVRFGTLGNYWTSPLNHQQELKFSTPFGDHQVTINTFYSEFNNLSISSSFPYVNDKDFIYLPVNSFIDILLIAAGGGGSGSTQNFPYSVNVNGKAGASVNISANDFYQFMRLMLEPTDQGVNLASAVGGGGAFANPANSPVHSQGSGGAAVITNDTLEGIKGGISIVGDLRLYTEVIYTDNGNAGGSGGNPLGGGSGTHFPIGSNTGTEFGEGGRGGTVNGGVSNINDFAAGGGSGGALLVRFIYRNIPVSGASAELRGRSKYVPPLRINLPKNAGLLGGDGGVGNVNGGNGRVGRVQIQDFGLFYT